MRRSRAQQAAARRRLVLGQREGLARGHEDYPFSMPSAQLSQSYGQQAGQSQPKLQQQQQQQRQRQQQLQQQRRSITPTYMASLSDDEDEIGSGTSYGNEIESNPPNIYDGPADEDRSVDSVPSRFRMPTRPMSGMARPSSAPQIPERKAITKQRRSLKRVRVAVRCRPVFPDLDFAGMNSNEDMRPAVRTEPQSPTKDEPAHLHVYPSRGSQFAKRFRFDHVFGPEASQTAVYETLAKPIVADVLQGMNGAIIAYGQTGTGKTYTMGILDRVSAQGSSGIIPNALRQIFDSLEREFGTQSKNTCPGGGHCACEWTVELSFLQIYLETLQDLFAPFFGNSLGEPLSMRQDPKSGFFVQGLRTVPVRSLMEAITLINLGLESRQMASTGMNAASSRSHTVLTAEVTVHRCKARVASQTGVVTTISRLRLVDLAGSERVRTASRASTQVKEAQSINMSLSALGNVVAALAQRDQQATFASASRPSTSTSISTTSAASSAMSRSQAGVHVPFRGSQLTKLLQDTLGGGSGGSNTVLIATVSPSPESCRETLSTLKFASRCMRVRSDAQIRSQETGAVDYARLCAALENKLEAAQADFARREATLRRSYESRIAELARGEGPLGGHALYFDMYRTVMELETGFRKRLDEQRASLRTFVQEQVPHSRQSKLLGITISDPAQDDDRLGVRVAAALGMSPAEISKSHLRSQPLPPGTSAEELAVHARIASEALRIEAEDANALLHLVMDELLAQYTQGAKHEEDLASCSTILEFLLKTNADLRAEIGNIGPGAWQIGGSAKGRGTAAQHSGSEPTTSSSSASSSTEESNPAKPSRRPRRVSQLDEYLGAQ